MQIDRGNVKYDFLLNQIRKEQFLEQSGTFRNEVGNPDYLGSSILFPPNNKTSHRIQTQIPNIFLMNIPELFAITTF